MNKRDKCIYIFHTYNKNVSHERVTLDFDHKSVLKIINIFEIDNIVV